MTEKEFLKVFTDFCYKEVYPELRHHILYEGRFEELSNKFLEQHHQIYCEVEFIKKEIEESYCMVGGHMDCQCHLGKPVRRLPDDYYT